MFGFVMRFELLIELLDNVLWAQGSLVLIIGVLYKLSARSDLGGVSDAERRAFSDLLGDALIWMAFGQLIAAWTGGVVAFVKENDAPLVGWLVVGSRFLSVVGWLRTVSNSLLRWRQVRRKQV